MHKYPAGLAVTIAFPLVDNNGDPLTPSSLSARVLDEAGVEIISAYNVPNSDGDAEIEVTIPASANQVASGMAGRTVELTLTTADGMTKQVQNYLLEAVLIFAVPSVSFQTFIQAVILADLIPNLTEWMIADDESRQRALLEAYRRLTRIGYRIRKRDDLEQNVVSDYLDIDEAISPRQWQQMGQTRWAALPDRFKQAIARAQIVEANEILRGVRPDDKRRMGILSESIGESSMMFRVGKPLDLGISQAALRELAGYVDMRATVTRT